MQKITWPNYKRRGIWVDPPHPPCFFKIPTFSRFFVADVPKAAKPLAQIDRVHGIPEQIQVSVKGISTLLI